MSKQVDELMTLADRYATQRQHSHYRHEIDARQELRAALEAALTPGEPDDKRQARALSHAYCLYSNLLKTDDAAMQAFRSVWADAFTHGFQSGKTAAPPAQLEGGPAGSGGWEKFALEMERQRDYWRQRVDTLNDYKDGNVWFWQGDGEDHLESMGKAMLVVIRADQLRELSAPPAQPKPLTVEQYTALAHRVASKYAHRSDPKHVAYTFLPHTLESFVRGLEELHGIKNQEGGEV